MSLNVKTLADLRRALAAPGVLVFMERNDRQASRLMREPETMRRASAPRTVIKVRSSDVLLRSDEGPTSYMTLPKAADLRADGSNTFSVVLRDRMGRDNILTYRLEMPGTPGADVPSMLSRAHPPLEEAQLAAEERALEAARAEAARREAAHAAEYERLRSLPPPQADPRRTILDAATEAAVEDALDAGVFYDDDMKARVRAATARLEFASFERLPDLHASLGADDVTRHQRIIQAAADLAHAPRGAWRIALLSLPTEENVRADVMMSDGGAGRAHMIRPAHERTADYAYERMRGREIYDARQRVEARQRAAAEAEALARRDFREGQELKNVKINGTVFSTGTVLAVDRDRRTVRLQLRKRGSPRIYEGTVSATALDRAVKNATKAG